MNVKILKGALEPCSKKDLKAVADEAIRTLRKVGFERTIEHFQKLIADKTYIKYRSNLKGLSHHAGLGPSRRPIKVYQYMVDTLKGQRGNLKYIETLSKGLEFKEIIINESSAKRAKGVRRMSRMRAYRQNPRVYRAIIRVELK